MFPFFGDRPVGGSFWQRFRTAAEGFTVTREPNEPTAWHVVTGAGRAVELFVELLGELPPSVSLEIADAHTGRRWQGTDCDTTGVRGALAPLREALVAHGGVEITVFSKDDQVTLNPVLELFLYSTGDRWTEILRAHGLPEERLVRTHSWKLRRQGLTPAPALSDAVAGAAAALRLTPL
ncbi:MAG TPA: hypothetical protein VMT93_07225 [Gemmatimonadaceae bacterium]|nr:hypothetical protein [Gemmatimonadaceae bacterium]